MDDRTQIGPRDEAAVRDLPPPPQPDVETAPQQPVDARGLDFLFRLHTLPCFRDSGLVGVASGSVISALRLARTRNSLKALDAFVGVTFVVSIGNWLICRRNWRQEQNRVRTALELQVNPPPPPESGLVGESGSGGGPKPTAAV